MTLTQQQQQNWLIWKERWQALDQTLTDLTSYYKGLPSDFPRKETLYYLVKHLQAFGEKQFCFFWDGFYYAEEDLIRHEENSRVILDDSDVFQPEYVLQATLDQISHDLEVIQRAANARMPNSPKRMRDTLDIADKLAWKYLQPALEANLVEQGTTVLTYFQKSASIRLIPYAPVALIGIPPTAFRTPGAETTDDTLVARDLLTTAHEVGHYVYRRGTFNEKPIYRELAERIKDILPQYKRWAEETFADSYAGEVGGAVTALSSQDLALRYYSKREFFKDDGEHPPANFRPYIYVKVLKEKGNGQMNRIADDLRIRWGHRRGNRITELVSGQIEFENEDQPELGDGVISLGSEITDTEPVDKIISKVLDILNEVPLDSSDKDSVVDSLYPNFKAKLKLIDQETVVPLQELKLNPEVPEEDQLKPWEEWIKKEKFFPGNNNEVPVAGVIDAGSEVEITSNLEPTEDYWIHLAYCAGWSTKIGNHSGG